MRKRLWAGLVAVSGLMAQPGAAMDLATQKLVVELGSVLGSEALCNLSFDLDAVDTFIDRNVSPEDMGFAASLHMMTEGSRLQYAAIEGAHLRAHCRAVEATARHHGLLE